MTAPDRPASSRRRYSSSPFALRLEVMRRYMRAKNGCSTFSSAVVPLIDRREDGTRPSEPLCHASQCWTSKRLSSACGGGRFVDTRSPRAACGQAESCGSLGGPGRSDDAFEPDEARDLDIIETEAPRRWRLVGEVSSEHAQRLAETLASEGEADGDVTLDLTDVTFLDTMGLHVIAHAAIELGDRGRVVLESAKPWVRRVLLLSGVDAIPNVVLNEGSP